MYKTTIFNTWIASENTGDQIIMEASKKAISECLNDSLFVEIPTHEKLSFRAHKLIQNSTYKIVCGTCLLQSNFFWKKLWKINVFDSFFVKDAILLGVGWQDYSKNPRLFSKMLWKRLLSDKYIHSVRDEYTKQKLFEIGITNVVNTACPTMWDLTENHCKEIPQVKAKDVVTTITNYRKDVLKDNLMLDILSKNYENVYLWPQSYEDILYLEELECPSNLVIISPNLESYNSILKKDIDFVGTRLHGGIRALQNKKRTIIIGVDNRAIEKKEFGLRVIERENLNKLDNLINQKFKTEIKLPFEDIERFKNQFKIDNAPTKTHILFIVEKKVKEFLKICLKGKRG